MAVTTSFRLIHFIMRSRAMVLVVGPVDWEESLKSKLSLWIIHISPLHEYRHDLNGLQADLHLFLNES